MSRREGTRTLALALMAGVVGGFVGIAVASWLADGPEILGASWWEVMTAFGTVGAVVVTLGQYWYRERQSRAKLVIAANLAAPVIRVKLRDLFNQTQQICLAHQEVMADLSKSQGSRTHFANWATEMQSLLTTPEITYLASFALMAAKSVSEANAHLEQFKFYLMQPPHSGRDYSSQLIFKALDEIELAHDAYLRAQKDVQAWEDLH